MSIMKILHIYHIYPALFGGASRVVYEVTKELTKRGHKVSILTTDAYFDDKNEQEYKNGNITIFRFSTLFSWFAKKNIVLPSVDFILWVKRILRRFDCIHMHGHRNPYNVFISHYARKYNIPYIVQAHGDIPRIGAWRRLKWLYDVLFGYRLLHDASKVVALNCFEADQYMRMGVPEEKIAIIPNGLDLSEFANLPPKGAFKRKFGIPEEKKIILYLGRIHKTKGIDFLIKAYAHLINDMHYEDALLVLAGPDDGYVKEAKSLAQNLSISNFVLFTGLLSEEDKIRAYIDSDVVVNVEPLNVYGLVPLESAACSKPVVVSKTNAISEVVATGKFGYSVKYGSVTSLAFTLRKILSNEEFARHLGRNGRRYVFNYLDWRKIIKKYEQVYKEVANSEGRHMCPLKIF